MSDNQVWAKILKAYPSHDAMMTVARENDAALIEVDDEVGHSAVLLATLASSADERMPPRLACALLREHDGSTTIFYVDIADLARHLGAPTEKVTRHGIEKLIMVLDALTVICEEASDLGLWFSDEGYVVARNGNDAQALFLEKLGYVPRFFEEMQGNAELTICSDTGPVTKKAEVWCKENGRGWLCDNLLGAN